MLSYIHFVARMHSLVLNIRLDLIYSCFAIFMIRAIVGTALRLWRLLGMDWRSNL